MWLLTKLAGIFSKTAVDVAKGVTGAASDISNIQKNKLDIKLKEIELEEKDSRLKIATFEEIKEYDPKIKAIELGRSSSKYSAGPSRKILVRPLILLLLLAILLTFRVGDFGKGVIDSVKEKIQTVLK